LFNPTLNTPTGPNKRVTDTGPLIDPTLEAINGATSIFDAAVGVAGAISDKKKADKAAASAQVREERAQRGEQRAIRSAERQEVEFAQRQDDRISKDRSDNFQDSLATSLRGLSKTQSAIKQGALPSTSLRLETEKSVTSLLTEFPDMSAELNEGFKKAGLSHLVIGDLLDQKSAHENEREAREAARTSAIKLAYDRGLADDSTPEHQAVSIGQTVSATEAHVKQLKEQQQLINDNRRLKLDEREAELKSIDRELGRSALSATRQLSGAVTNGFINRITQVNTPEEFSQLQAQAPQVLANLEQERFNLHELAGYDKDIMSQIDKQIDRQVDFISKMSTGDLSHGKREATRLKNLMTNAKIGMFEANPALLEMEVLPRSVSEPVMQGIGITLAGDAELTKGLGDLVSGIVTEASSYYKTVTDPSIPVDSPALTVKESKGKIKFNAYAHGQSVRSLLSGNAALPVEVTAPEFIQAHTAMLPMYNKLVSETQDTFKDMKAGSGLLFAPEVAQALEVSMNNPETKVEAGLAMTTTRKMADKTLRSIDTNSRNRLEDSTWVRFSSSTGRFEAVFSVERAQKRLDTLRRTGAPFLPDLPDNIADTPPETEGVERAETLNTALDFLVRTRDHDKSIAANLPEFEYRKAFATGDFSKLGQFVNDPAALQDISVQPQPKILPPVEEEEEPKKEENE